MYILYRKIQTRELPVWGGGGKIETHNAYLVPFLVSMAHQICILRDSMYGAVIYVCINTTDILYRIHSFFNFLKRNSLSLRKEAVLHVFKEIYS